MAVAESVVQVDGRTRLGSSLGLRLRWQVSMPHRPVMLPPPDHAGRIATWRALITASASLVCGPPTSIISCLPVAATSAAMASPRGSPPPLCVQLLSRRHAVAAIARVMRPAGAASTRAHPRHRSSTYGSAIAETLGPHVANCGIRFVPSRCYFIMPRQRSGVLMPQPCTSRSGGWSPPRQCCS